MNGERTPGLLTYLVLGTAIFFIVVLYKKFVTT